MPNWCVKEKSWVVAQPDLDEMSFFFSLSSFLHFGPPSLDFGTKKYIIVFLKNKCVLCPRFPWLRAKGDILLLALLVHSLPA